MKSQKARKYVLFEVPLDTMATIITFLHVWKLILQPGVSVEQDFIMVHVLKVLLLSKNHFIFSQTDRCVGTGRLDLRGLDLEKSYIIDSLTSNLSVYTQLIVYAKHEFESQKARNSRAAY